MTMSFQKLQAENDIVSLASSFLVVQVFRFGFTGTVSVATSGEKCGFLLFFDVFWWW